MKPKILFACKFADSEAKKRIECHAEITELDECTEQSILDNIAGHIALIVPYTANMVITKKVIDAGKELKLVGTTYGGTRQNVDDVYAVEKGLYVIHTGPTRPRPMAEYTLGLVLSSLLEIHNYHHHMNSDEPWPRFKYGRSRILHNRRVGIIGFGLIGRGIYDLFNMFTDDIWIRSNHMSDAQANELNVTKGSLNDIFENCEIIILAGGHTDATTHLLGKEQFDLMQEQALFVNIARGKMVDEKAMAEAVTTKNIHLALDVFEAEPLPETSLLRNNDKVLLTPHRANNPIEFEQRWQFLADEFDQLFSGKKPQTALTLNRIKVMSES
jgi:phosphoglycerate dehydrogenase-like enzyme